MEGREEAMEVVVPIQDLDFHFDSTNTTPNVSVPSSPKGFGDSFDYYYYHHYASTPISPSHATDILSGPFSPSPASSRVPFNWEDKPDVETKDGEEEDDDNFVFNFSGQLQKGELPLELTAADKLFEKGKIRLLNPPPRLHHLYTDDSTQPPVSPRTRGLWSTHRSREKDIDPFTAAMVEVTRERGRETNPFSTSSSRSRKGSRSLSPLRGGGVGVFEKTSNSSPPSSTSSSTTLKSRGSKKWKLRDLLLFRSASEGRATGNRSKDPLRKFTIFPSLSPNYKRSGAKAAEELRSTSFHSTDGNGLIRRGSSAAISAHEMHYTENRAAAEALKKTTPFPYRQGLFGFLGAKPTVNNYSFNHRS